MAGTYRGGIDRGQFGRQEPMQPDPWSNRILTPQVNAIVKNTFVNVIDASDEEDRATLRRSASDGDLSKSSGESPEQVVGYFLPSLWSSSGSSVNRTQGTRETAPWLRGHAAASASGGALSGSASNSGRPLPLSLSKPTAAPAPTPNDGHPPPSSSSLPLPRRVGMLQGGPPAAIPLREPLVTEYEPYEPSSADPYPDAPDPMPFWNAGGLTRDYVPRNDIDASRQPAPGLLTRVSAAMKQAMDKAECEAPNPNGCPPVDENSAMLAGRIYAELKGRISMEKLEELAQAGVLAQIPRNATNELSSAGSIHHAAGTCTPCAYWFKGICKYGISCLYCHFAHNGQRSKRLRPSKQTRVRIRKWDEKKAAENGTELPPGDLDRTSCEDADSSHDEGPPRAHRESL